MRASNLSRKHITSLLIFFCVVVISMTSVRGTRSDGLNKKILSKSLTTSAALRGQYNGKLVFASDRQKKGDQKLWTMNPDGSSPTQLTFESERGPTLPPFMTSSDDRPKWSPDGSKIALRSLRDYDPNDPGPSGYTLYIMDYPANNVQRLILSQLPNQSSDICAEIDHTFQWSPDGSKLAFDYGQLTVGDDFCQGIFHSNVYVVNVNGSGLVRLTNDTSALNRDVTWSPSGDQIAFVSEDQTGEGARTIDVMNSDGTNRRRIISFAHEDGVGTTAWSPDGSKILFWFARGTCQVLPCSQLYTIKPDGTGLTQLSHSSGGYWSAMWSPDGTKIVSVRNLVSNGQSYAVFVMNADGSDEHQISNRGSGSFGDYDVDWQPLLSPSNEAPPSVLGLQSGILFATYPDPPTIQITVMRTGNLNGTVSCDYQIRHGSVTSAAGTLMFGQGEVSKTVSFSNTYGESFNLSLFNNAGNATFVGGVKDATLIFLGQNNNAIDYSPYFVRQHYRDFLNREPDQAGWDFWTNNIEKCGSFNSACRDPQRISTSASFFLSIEFQQTGYLVERIYKTAFGDVMATSTINGTHTLSVPVVRFSDFLHDTQEIGQGVVVLQSGWEQQLESNKQAFVTDFVGRSAFSSAFPTSMTPDQFVSALNANAGNTLSSSKRAETVALFGGASDTSNLMARAQALRQVAENQSFYDAEFNHAFVLMQYFGYLRRNPDDVPEATRDYSGYDFWLTKLNSFNGNYINAEMVKAFITSSEYRQRFGP
jgi:Tol biopolymer transport system component